MICNNILLRLKLNYANIDNANIDNANITNANIDNTNTMEINNTTLLLIVIIIVMGYFAYQSYDYSSESDSSSDEDVDAGGEGEGAEDVANDDDAAADVTADADNQTPISSAVSAVVESMRATINDVRGASGISHGKEKASCPHPNAKLNLVNGKRLFSQSYGEKILGDSTTDMDKPRAIKSRVGRNDIVSCVREYVDECQTPLSATEQYDQDRHLLSEYILPVDVQYQTYE